MDRPKWRCWSNTSLTMKDRVTVPMRITWSLIMQCHIPGWWRDGHLVPRPVEKVVHFYVDTGRWVSPTSLICFYFNWAFAKSLVKTYLTNPSLATVSVHHIIKLATVTKRGQSWKSWRVLLWSSQINIFMICKAKIQSQKSK